jgi:hypothetical protein
MNDHELIAALRESFTDVRATTPVDQIVSRGRAVRARRRIPRVAGAAGVAGAAVLGVAALLSPGHQAGARLAAWTVVRHADGSIYVTINQLLDPAGLQRTLRADGVPASVTFFSQESPRSCHPYTSGDESGLIGKIFGDLTQPNEMIIHPAAIPKGAGLEISPNPSGGRVPAVAVGLVAASPQCTGS